VGCPVAATVLLRRDIGHQAPPSTSMDSRIGRGYVRRGQPYRQQAVQSELHRASAASACRPRTGFGVVSIEYRPLWAGPGWKGWGSGQSWREYMHMIGALAAGAAACTLASRGTTMVCIASTDARR
jgi:hypothetical protein